jgi:isoleucyl-tRNA synthetase
MMKSVNTAVTAFTQEQIAELEQNAAITITVEGQPVQIDIEDVEIISEDIPGWTIAQEGKFTVALDIEIPPELKLEGLSRLVIKRIQALRKDSGFEITDRIDVVIEDIEELHGVIETFGEHISAQVLANTIVIGDASEGTEQELGEFNAKILVRKTLA